MARSLEEKLRTHTHTRDGEETFYSTYARIKSVRSLHSLTFVVLFSAPLPFMVQWVNCRHLKLLILRMLFICFRFCLLCSKPESVEDCLRGKKHHNAFHYSRNLEMASCTVGIHLEDPIRRVFGFQSGDGFILMKTKHPVHIRVFFYGGH